MKLTFTEFGKPAHFEPRVFLIQGADSTVQHEVLDRLLSGLLPEGREMNLTFLDGPQAQGKAVVGMVQTIPFLAARRVVVLRNVERMPKDEQKALVSALEENRIPPSGALILLRTPNPPGSGRGPDLTALVKAVEKNGLVVQCDLVGKPREVDATLGRMALAEAQRLGKRMMPTTAERLVQRCEPAWGVVQHEVHKLALYVGEAPAITDADVVAVVPELREEAVFKLVDGLVAGNLRDSLERAAHLLAQGEAVEMILWNLSRHFRLLLQARHLTEQRRLTERGLVGGEEAEFEGLFPQEQNLVHELRRNPWKAQQFARQARAFDTPRIARTFERLLQTDLHLKGGEGGTADRRLELELLCVDLCR